MVLSEKWWAPCFILISMRTMMINHGIRWDLGVANVQTQLDQSLDTTSSWIQSRHLFHLDHQHASTLKSSVFSSSSQAVKTHKASRSSNPTFDWGDLSGCLPQLWTRCSSPQTSVCSRSKFGRGFCDTRLRTEPSILWRRYNLVGGFNHIEKYERQLGKSFPYMMENKKCLKPPTSNRINRPQNTC